jgi:hypothetical protein
MSSVYSDSMGWKLYAGESGSKVESAVTRLGGVAKGELSGGATLLAMHAAHLLKAGSDKLLALSPF